MIRQLPGGRALVIRGGCSPVIAKLPTAWHDPAYRRARAVGEQIAALRRLPHHGLRAERPGPDDVSLGLKNKAERSANSTPETPD